MNRLILSAMAALLSLAAAAQVSITKVDKISPTDEVYMDMAVTAASTARDQGLKPCGAVVILNGAWRSTGTPTDGTTAEQAAIAKSRRKSLSGAVIYTVNQPTAAAMEAIAGSGADAVYFVNPAADVVAAGIYTEADYAPADGTEAAESVPVMQMDYAPARKFVGK